MLSNLCFWRSALRSKRRITFGVNTVSRCPGHPRAHRLVMVSTRGILPSGIVPDASSEISFNVRYPEKNGRSRGDPWSMRQTGIYHAYDHEAQRSICILLQPPSYILEAITKDWKLNSMGSSHALLLHLLSLLEWKWHSYLDYLWSCLRPFVSSWTTCPRYGPMMAKSLGRESFFLERKQIKESRVENRVFGSANGPPPVWKVPKCAVGARVTSRITSGLPSFFQQGS